jgi:T5SS/PEP-CTERM-associated repeat protein
MCLYRFSVIGFAVLSLARVGSAAEYLWDANGANPATGSFSVANNWNPNVVPGAADRAIFAVGSGATYTTRFRGRQVLDPPLTYALDRMRIGANTVNFVDDTNLGQLIPANLAVNYVSTGGSDAGIIVGDVAGEIAVLNTTLSNFSGLTATIGNAVGSTGTVNVNGGSWTLSSATGNALMVGHGGTGTLNITGGAQVNLNVVLPGYVGNLNNSTGTITVSGAGSKLSLGGTLIVGNVGTGILNVRDGGMVELTGSSDQILLGRQVGGNSTLRVGNGGAAGTILAGYIQGHGIGDAQLIFNHNEAAYQLVPIPSGDLIVRHQGPGKTILLDGSQYDNLTEVTGGTLRVENGFAGERNVTVSGGVFEVAGGLAVSSGTLLLSGGEILTDTMTMGTAGIFNFQGGRLHTEIFTGNLTNQGGTLAPGIAAGGTTIIGNYTQQAGATLQIEIGGTATATQFDFVNVTGTAQLGGQLQLALINSFVPSPTDQFTVLNAGDLLSFFSNAGNGQRVNLANGAGSFVVHYGPTSAFNPDQIVLTSFLPPQSVPGDFDSDGDVDGADFVAWQTNFPKSTGATLAQGDADGDGDVDGADFVVWQTNFPFTPGPAAAPVPEPRALLLGLLAIGELGVRMRWKRTGGSRNVAGGA